MEYGLIGEKLGHSFSKRIHESMWCESYDLAEMTPPQAEEFFRRRSFKGVNVTIPYKRLAASMCDRLDPIAARIGGVNTVVREADGSLSGYNTDYFGFKATLLRAGFDCAGKKALVLGSGGTSATARAVLRDLGAGEIMTVSRSGPVRYEDLGAHADAQLIVNTTPVGMYPNNGRSPVELSGFAALCGVADVIYNPLRTALLLSACDKGIPFANGLYMLVAQAAYAASLFTGGGVDPAQAEPEFRKLLRGICNIVLIGMPGCGKTSVGRRLAAAFGRPLIDTDEEVERAAGKPIPQIFAEDGEGAFRQMEERAVAEAGKRSGVIIATGGGAVLSEKNRAALRQNGRIYHIERDIAALARDGRPLSKGADALADMYAAREPIYRALCDRAVRNDSIAECVKEIEGDFNENTGDQRAEYQYARHPRAGDIRGSDL